MTDTVTEGKRRASAAWAQFTSEQRALAEGAEDCILTRFARLFAGTEDMCTSKGHQPCMVVSVETMREFRKTEPATHVWAAWEAEMLDTAEVS